MFAAIAVIAVMFFFRVFLFFWKTFSAIDEITLTQENVFRKYKLLYFLFDYVLIFHANHGVRNCNLPALFALHKAPQFIKGDLRDLYKILP